jgi:lactate dehydrogenase-like 2-hydroxyacid dehydrogenase
MLTDKVDEELLDTAGNSCEPFDLLIVSYVFLIPRIRLLIRHTGQQLKVVSTMSVGYDHVDVDAIKTRKVPLGYTPDVLTDATADLTALLTLAAARRIKEVGTLCSFDR